jgi:16S rRNA (cytosine1402-N4)-methyltransferase
MTYHTPVLLEETIELLVVQPGGRYIDCTLGTGGHAAAILEESSPGGELLGIDADPEAIKIAKARLQPYDRAFLLVNSNFENLESICIRCNFRPVHGILFDLGMSSLQLESPNRGFSFKLDAPLDMRFGPSQELTAADIVNTFSESELVSILETYGEEHRSRRIAKQIVVNRPINTALQLARTVERAVGGNGRRIHPATKTFQALRITVNQELKHLQETLKQAVNLLGFGGRLVVISYHSLEDRLVKEFFHQESRGCICPPDIPVCICGHEARLKLVTKKVVTPQSSEIEANPRSRSAKLRAVERI